ncbi:MAG: hypothetical protein FJ206_15640 [Gemmatimonadetes bacterium]|nr:hypothetical protein [Gemmatimonadota bacterium]
MIARGSFRPLALATLLALLGGGALGAQSSQFGIRGLGIPIRPLSPRALAVGGAFGMFDIESSQNPAATASTIQFAALFTNTQNFRRSSNPFGSASGYDNRFPQLMVTGPIGGTNLAAAISLSGYLDRSFSLGTRDTIDIRGVPVGVFDTLSSRGGLTDIRLATGWQVTPTFHLGLGLHAITGLTRFENRRDFADSTFAPIVERSEVSYLGLGLSAGFTLRPVRRLTIAGAYRNDGHLDIDRDSTRIAKTDLPAGVSAGIRWQASEKVMWAASAHRRSWKSADADIRAQNGIGAENTIELATGLEFVRDPKNAGHRPWRFGVHYATLPFPFTSGDQPTEFGISAGTGIRFTQGRGGLDLTVQQIFRRSNGGFKENATVVSLGVSIRP